MRFASQSASESSLDGRLWLTLTLALRVSSDHPSWFGRVEHYLGSFTPFIHELFINIRGPGGFIGCHSGGPRFDEDGHILASRWGAAVYKDEDTDHDEYFGQGSHRGHKVAWGVPYLSMIVALEDIGPGVKYRVIHFVCCPSR